MSAYGSFKPVRLAAATLALAPLLAAAPAAAQRATPVTNTVKHIPFSCFRIAFAGGLTCRRMDQLADEVGGFFTTVPTGYTQIVTEVGVEPEPGDLSAVLVNFNVVLPDGTSLFGHVARSANNSYRATSSSSVYGLPSGARIGVNDGSATRKNVFVFGYLVKNEEVGL